MARKSGMRMLLGALLSLLLASCALRPAQELTASSSVQLKREDLGAGWPFTVDRGTIECELLPGDPELYLVFRADGRTYALNEAARARANTRDVAEIVAQTPQGPADLAPILAFGNQACTSVDQMRAEQDRGFRAAPGGLR